VPATPPGVKALVLNDTAVELVFLPPSGKACFSGFIVTGRDAAGAALPTRKVNGGLSTIFSGLTRGATYEFAVAANSASKGASGTKSTRVALPPSLLDAEPGPPERFKAVAISESSMQLTWDLPASNPRVDAYVITALQVNATGYPLKGGGQGDTELRVPAGQRSAVVNGLKPGADYGFAIQSVANKFGQDGSDPALAFRSTPPAGASRPPSAPQALTADAAGNGTVVLRWQPPAGAAPDLYLINITQIDPADGQPLSDTNTIPYLNTTAVINELQDGQLYRFAVQALSVSYDAGGSTSIVYTLPTAEALAARQQQQQQQRPPAGPVQGLTARPTGSDAAQLDWQPPAGGPAPNQQYLVQASDQITGRPLGRSYITSSPQIILPGLPFDSPLEILVQVRSVRR